MAAPGGSGSVGELPVPQLARGGLVAQSVAWRRAKVCAVWNNTVKLSLAKPSATLERPREQLKGVDFRAAGTAVVGVDVALSREPVRVPRTHARARAHTHTHARALDRRRRRGWLWLAQAAAAPRRVCGGVRDNTPSLA